MNSIYFTKPKQTTLECLKFMVAQGENILGVIICNKQDYENSKFINYCTNKNISVYDYTEADTCFNRNKGNIELIYCNTFPKKIKNEWISQAEIAAINFHSAPLPEYRGVFGYNFAILNQETEYGVSCHFLSSEFDEGDMIEVLRFPYDCLNGNVGELVELSNYYLLQLFRKIYMKYKNGESIKGTKQSCGNYYSRKDFELAKKITIQDSPERILRKIRAFWYPPYEGAYMVIDNQKVFLVLEENYRSVIDE